MAISGLGAPLSGIQANQLRVDVGANNIANVNTPGFQPSTVQTADAAYVNDVGQGTQVTGTTYSPPRPTPPAANGGQIGVPEGQGVGAAAVAGLVEQSNVDMVSEATSQLGAQHAYNANIAMIQTADDMARTAIDLIA